MKIKLKKDVNCRVGFSVSIDGRLESYWRASSIIAGHTASDCGDGIFSEREAGFAKEGEYVFIEFRQGLSGLSLQDAADEIKERANLVQSLFAERTEVEFEI